MRHLFFLLVLSGLDSWCARSPSVTWLFIHPPPRLCRRSTMTLTTLRHLPVSSPPSQKQLVIATDHLLTHFANRFLPPSRWLSSRSRPSPAPSLSSVLSPPVLSPMSFLSFPRLLCVCSHPREAPRPLADLYPAAQTTTYQPVTQQHGVATADGM